MMVDMLTTINSRNRYIPLHQPWPKALGSHAYILFFSYACFTILKLGWNFWHIYVLINNNSYNTKIVFLYTRVKRPFHFAPNSSIPGLTNKRANNSGV